VWPTFRLADVGSATALAVAAGTTAAALGLRRRFIPLSTRSAFTVSVGTPAIAAISASGALPS
jgi:hypothetical protein